MKLKEGFITHESDGKQILAAVGGNDFSGLVRSNRTAGMIIDCLKKETTREEIIAYMKERFEAPEGRIEKDVDKVVSILRSIHALDE